MEFPRWTGVAIGLGLWALAIAIKVPVLHSPPYWDEGLHYWTAKHLGRGFGIMSDLWGNPIGTPQYLFFQRPLFYLMFWLPAQGGFQAFRTAHAIAASILAPLAYAVLRAHGVRRPGSVLAGIAVAAMPSLAMWGNLGLMDSLMTAWIAVMLWARARGNNVLVFIASVAAVWTKETAYAAVAGLLVYEAFVGWSKGAVRFAPLQLDGRVTALALATFVAPWPLMWAVVHDLAQPGAVNHGSFLPVIDRMFNTPWLIPILLLGLAKARSRFLCGFALTSGAFLIGLQVAARDVPQWYEVPTAFLGLAGVAAAADAWWRDGAPSWTRPGPAVVAVALVCLMVWLPNSPTRDHLHPLAGDGGNSLEQSYDFENTIRDADLHAAIEALPLDGQNDVYGVDVAAAALFGPVTEGAHHVYWDSSWIRTLLEIAIAPVAWRIEDNNTWTILDRSELPLATAIEGVYADCITFETPGFLVLQGTPCAGRADQLERAWRDLDPRF